MSDLLVWSLVAGTALSLLLQVALPGGRLVGKVGAALYVLLSLGLALLVVYLVDAFSTRAIVGAALVVLVSALSTGKGLWPNLIAGRT